MQVARMDATTNLAGIVLDATTRLADVLWNGVTLSRLDWDQVPTLGEEREVRTPTTGQDKVEEEDMRLQHLVVAVRANRQLAVVLREQGLKEHADRFEYRAQRLQRDVHWHRAVRHAQVLPPGPVAVMLGRMADYAPIRKTDRVRHLANWAGSIALDALAGYGYRLWRILVAYGGVLAVFTLVYWLLGVHSFPPHHRPPESAVQSMWDACLVSLSAIHGRTTFEQLGAWSPAAWVAAVESVVGIVIEGVFVAMLIQRFFGR
jgi:hypothetical protein